MSVYTKKFLKFNTSSQGIVYVSADSIENIKTDPNVQSINLNTGWNRQYTLYYQTPPNAEGTSTSVVANKLVDSAADFIAAGVSVGDKVVVVNGGSATVTAVDSATQLSLDSDPFTATGLEYDVWTPSYAVQKALVDGIQKAISSKWRDAVIDLEVPSGFILTEI
jgi:hypothetical protein